MTADKYSVWFLVISLTLFRLAGEYRNFKIGIDWKWQQCAMNIIIVVCSGKFWNWSSDARGKKLIFWLPGLLWLPNDCQWLSMIANDCQWLPMIAVIAISFFPLGAMSIHMCDYLFFSRVKMFLLKLIHPSMPSIFFQQVKCSTISNISFDTRTHSRLLSSKHFD